jgi:Cysteine rich repeat
MRALIHALLLAAALMPFGLRPASAQAADVLYELMANCRPDVAEFCSDVEPGGGRVAACLYSRIHDLSPRCHRAMRDGIAMRACGGDVARYCRDIPPGDGRIAFCLRDFREDLSPRCLDALADSLPKGRRYSQDVHPPKLALPYQPRRYSEEYYSRKYSEEPAPEAQDGDDGEDGYSIK